MNKTNQIFFCKENIRIFSMVRSHMRAVLMLLLFNLLLLCVMYHVQIERDHKVKEQSLKLQQEREISSGIQKRREYNLVVKSVKERSQVTQKEKEHNTKAIKYEDNRLKIQQDKEHIPKIQKDIEFNQKIQNYKESMVENNPLRQKETVKISVTKQTKQFHPVPVIFSKSSQPLV